MGACLDDLVAVRLGTMTAAEECGGEQGARRVVHNRCHEQGTIAGQLAGGRMTFDHDPDMRQKRFFIRVAV